MRVTILKTGEAREYDDSYAARLVEQGRAIPSPAADKAAEPAVQTPQAAPAEKKTAKARKEKTAGKE